MVKENTEIPESKAQKRELCEVRKSFLKILLPSRRSEKIISPKNPEKLQIAIEQMKVYFSLS